MIEKIVNIKVEEDGFDSVSKKVNSLDSDLNHLENQNENLSKSFQTSSNSVLDNGGAMGLLNDLTGGYAMMLKDAVEASDLFTKSTKAQTIAQTISTLVVGTSTGAMKAFRIALITTGIGAIVVGLGLLIANFTKVKDAVMTLIPGLKAVGDFVMSIVDAVTDFIGVTSDATRELDKLNNTANENLKRNQRFLDAYGDKYDEFTKRKIEANNNYYNKVKEINEAEDLSTREKLKQISLLRERANRDILKAEDDRQEQLAKKRADEYEKQKELAQKIADEQKKKAEEKRKAEEEAFKLRQDGYKADAELFFKSLEDAKTAREKLAEEQKSTFEDFISTQEKTSDYLLEQISKNKENDKLGFDERLLLNQIYLDEALRDTTMTQDQIDEVKKKSNETEIALNKLKKDAIIGDALQTLNSIAQLAGEGTAIAKGVAVAQATMSGIEGVQNAYTTAQKSPITAFFPAYPLVQAGLAGVFSGLQIKKILSVDKSGKGGGSATSGGSAPAPPQFNIVGQSGTNQLAQSIGAKQGQPIQAYVVGNEVTSQQALDRNRITTATFN